MNNNNSITFVTAYFKVYETEYDISRTFNNRLYYFMKLLKIGIKIHIFIDPEMEDLFSELKSKYNNLIVTTEYIDNLTLYKNYCKYNTLSINLPINRNTNKDTTKYMLLMLSKLNFLKKAIDINGYNSNYFCWVDFSLPYIFKNMDGTLLKIKNISNATFNGKFIYVPGCWNNNTYDITYLKNNVVWRFCGGVLFGDKNSIIEFDNTSNEYFAQFLKETNTLVWEVNYWAWLEIKSLFKPIWYLANHDDTIFNIPTQLV